MHHRFAGFDQCGEMQYGLKRIALVFGNLEDICEQSPVCEVALDEIQARRNHLATSVAKVIKNRRLVAHGGEQRCNCATHITGTTSNQNSHKNTVLPERIGLP